MICSMLFSVFICLSLSVVIECNSFICWLVKPNDVYKGIGLTERFGVDGTRSDWMNNRQGSEWKTEFYETDDGTIGLKMNEKSVMKVNKEMAQRFGIFYTDGTDSQTGNCDVIVKKGDTVNTTIDCKFQYNRERPYNKTYNIQSTDRTLSLKPFPSLKADPNSAYLLVVNQEDKKERKLLKFEFNKTLLTINCSVVPSLCWNIKFIDQMSDELFKQVGSIVEYNILGFGFGHVLWFDISGRPKYCLQPENESLAKNCKSVDNLSDVPDVDYCLPSKTTSTSSVTLSPVSTTTDSTEDNGILTYVWISIALIVVLALIVVALLGTVFYLDLKKPIDSGSPARPVQSSPLERFRRNVQRKYKDESSSTPNTESTVSL